VDLKIRGRGETKGLKLDAVISSKSLVLGRVVGRVHQEGMNIGPTEN
jgi:hypothetical protein